MSYLLLDRFNPTLVRLRPIPFGPGQNAVPRFNPTLVRLRRESCWPAWLPAGRVSIPRWFD